MQSLLWGSLAKKATWHFPSLPSVGCRRIPPVLAVAFGGYLPVKNPSKAWPAAAPHRPQGPILCRQSGFFPSPLLAVLEQGLGGMRLPPPFLAGLARTSEEFIYVFLTCSLSFLCVLRRACNETAVLCACSSRRSFPRVRRVRSGHGWAEKSGGSPLII